MIVFLAGPCDRPGKDVVLANCKKHHIAEFQVSVQDNFNINA